MLIVLKIGIDMIRFCVKVMIALLLSSCSEKQDFSTPAQSHIDGYRLQMQQCVAANTNSPIPAKPATEANNIFAIDDSDLVFGDPKAKVVVIQYGAPTCAHCAYFYKKIYPELKKNYIDDKKIAYVIREFISNKQDLDATTLVYCGDLQKRTQLIDVLYSQQESWAFNENYRSILTNIAQLSGISQEQYEKCLDDKDLQGSLVAKARAISRVSGFIGTPAFVINGLLYSGEYSYQALSKAIDASLNQR